MNERTIWVLIRESKTDGDCVVLGIYSSKDKALSASMETEFPMLTAVQEWPIDPDEPRMVNIEDWPAKD